jgi:2-hydroxy-6-oxonona-2,4-dienedioate hydrolase
MDLQLREEGEFRYVSEGKGEPLVLLHGLFGALSNFNSAIAHFSQRNRVIVPVLPLYTMPVLSTGVSSLADHLNRFLDHLGLERVHLLGNSLGGHVALIFASRHPQRVATLVLTGSSGLYENAFGESFPRREDKDYIRRKVAVTFHDPKHATEELVEECYNVINDRGNLLRILALAKSAIRHNMAAEIPKLSMPCCLIWGKQDIVTPPEVAEDFHRLLPNSSLYWIDACGHAPMMEHPQEFNRLLEHWLDGIAHKQPGA